MYLLWIFWLCHPHGRRFVQLKSDHWPKMSGVRVELTTFGCLACGHAIIMIWDRRFNQLSHPDSFSWEVSNRNCSYYILRVNNCHRQHFLVGRRHVRNSGDPLQHLYVEDVCALHAQEFESVRILKHNHATDSCAINTKAYFFQIILERIRLQYSTNKPQSLSYKTFKKVHSLYSDIGVKRDWM